MNHRVIPIISLILLLLALSALAAVEYYPYIQSSQRYPGVITPAQAYLFTNGTLYLAVYNIGSQPVSLESLQVALTSAQSTEQLNSIMLYPNSPLSDGSVKKNNMNNGVATSTEESTEWIGGGIVNAGQGALLRFTSPNSASLFGEYYLAVGSPWFGSANLEPYTAYISINDSLPALIPLRAIVYPNETMSLNMMSTQPVKIGQSASVYFTFFFLANSSESAIYSVVDEGNGWYRLIGGQSLPTYMPLTEYLSNYDNPKTIVVYNMTSEPLYFAQSLVTQIAPIVAPTAQSIASTSNAGSSSMSLAVSWQVSLSGGRSFDLPATIYEGQYSMSSSVSGTTAKIGNLTEMLPSQFSTPYFNGTMILTLPNNVGASSVTVTISFGPEAPTCAFSGNKASCSAGNTTTS